MPLSKRSSLKKTQRQSSSAPETAARSNSAPPTTRVRFDDRSHYQLFHRQTQMKESDRSAKDELTIVNAKAMLESDQKKKTRSRGIAKRYDTNAYMKREPETHPAPLMPLLPMPGTITIPPPLSIPLPTPDQMAQVGILPQKRPKPQLTVPRKKVKIEQKTQKRKAAKSIGGAKKRAKTQT